MTTVAHGTLRADDLSVQTNAGAFGQRDAFGAPRSLVARIPLKRGESLANCGARSHPQVAIIDAEIASFGVCGHGPRVLGSRNQ